MSAVDNAHPASQRGGWGLRIHYKDRGGSYLNNYSLGDVVAYDTEADAKAAGAAVMDSYAGQHMYSHCTVEPVEKGAWVPSEYDSAIIELMAFAMPEAERGVLSAIRAVNRGRALLSGKAPAHMTRPLASLTGSVAEGGQMTFATREAAIVKSVTAGTEDHGILTSYLHMTGPSGGWGQGFGGLAFDEPHLEVWKADLCALFGVAKFEDIEGRNCFILRSWPSWGSPIEGLEVDGRRFTITGFRRKLWPDKTITPLDHKAQQLRNSIAYAGRDVQRFVGDLEKVADGYVDWEMPKGSAAT